jgi:transcriptional regulator with XRE-family HTH domain
MTELGAWLRAQLNKRRLTQNAAAVHAGVGQATISDILTKDHVPKVETLFRLADFFRTPREQVLRLAGHLPPAPPGMEAEAPGQDEALVRVLLAEFQQVPDEWKPVAVEQVATFRRLAELRPARIIGDEAEEEERGEGKVFEREAEDAEAAQAA